MSNRATAYQSVPDEDERDFPLSPGVVVLVLAVLFIGVIVIGVMLNRGSGDAIARVTVAELRADPDRWDSRVVDLTGQVEGIRELPVLSQYALYTFRDDTGSIMTLTQKGAPPSSATGTVRVRGIYHSKVQLDTALKRIIEEQLGPLAGSAVAALVPGIPLDVVYLEHQSYEVQSTTPTP
ncbi:MAG TPA: hypothetical protein VMM78_06625 [Thermomicrobiales bacterium]|nr:hypothetical protein [Thermomicrobiales bacterium]